MKLDCLLFLICSKLGNQLKREGYSSRDKWTAHKHPGREEIARGEKTENKICNSLELSTEGANNPTRINVVL